jgi:signal transduction histidine kinase
VLGITLLAGFRPGTGGWSIAADGVGMLVTGVQVVLVGGLLAWLSDYLERTRSRTSFLLGWPPMVPVDRSGLAQSLLDHVARALGVSHAVLAWEDNEEPWTWIAHWSDGNVALERTTAEELGPLAPDALQSQPFVVSEGGRASGTWQLVTQSNRTACSEDPLPASIRRLCNGAVVLSIPIQGESMHGRLFVPDPPDGGVDELVLGDLLGRQLALRLDQQGVFERLRAGALSHERLRIAQDLHDGVIQSLAAASLKLESARQLLRDRPQAAAQLIHDVQDLLLTEQRELREIVGTLGPDEASATRAGGGQSFQARLGTLVDRIAAYWGLEVVLHDRLDAAATAAGRGHQVCCLIQEALVNASRHGRATRVEVDLASDERELRLRVADNGGGFPFKGVLDMAALRASGLGPQSLMQRLLGLGGTMEIASSAAGATLTMRFPGAGTGAGYPAFGPVAKAHTAASHDESRA